MTRRALTAAGVARLRPPVAGQVDHFDAGYPGLALRISYGGSRSWVYFYRWRGKQRRLTLGPWPAVELAEARDAWREVRKKLAMGEEYPGVAVGISLAHILGCSCRRVQVSPQISEGDHMNSKAVGDRRILGSLGSADGKGVVRMEDSLDTDIDDVWSALTDPSRLARWYGEVEGDLRLGGEYRARLFSSGWEGTGRVEACEAPQRLLVRIKDADEPGESVIETVLSADADQTIVIWEERGMPLDLLSAYGAGVQIHVEDLADHLAGRERRDDAKARWDELHPAYQDLAADLS